MSKEKKNVIKFHGGEALVRALHAEGIEYIFGIPGGEYVPFLEAVDRWGLEHGMHYVNVRHEQGGSHMADAYARVTGKPAVCCGTVGPGFLNMIPGIGPAAWDKVPMIVIHPQQDLKFEDHHRLQGGLDQLAMLKPLVKYQKHISDPNRIVKSMQKCFKELFSGCPGVVQLEVREDAFYAEVEPYGQEVLPPENYRCIAPPAGNPDLIKKACNHLIAAKNPLIVAGGGITSSGSWDQLRELSLNHGIPVITTVMGIGTMSTNHDTYVGATLNNMTSMKAVREADFFLLLGTKLSYVMGYGKAPIWNADAKIVQVDIDPFMIGKNRPVDVGILGDVGMVMAQMEQELQARNCAKIGDEQWLQELKNTRKMMIDGASRKLTSTKTPIEPRRLIADLTDFMEPEDILCVDGGDIAVLTVGDIDFMKPREPRTVVQSIGMGHLGTCIPYAIGAKLGQPSKNVFAITGDGSFLFNIQEMDTAIKYCTPFVVVIADNCRWGMIQNAEKSAFKKRDPFCVEICSDYVKIAQGYGCYAERVGDPGDIKPALQRAVDSNLPAVLQVDVKFVSPPGGDLIRAFKDMKF